ncbi:MAG: hypothetical protein DRQ52_09055 [Gammaproteobacteria bacterium]|nr:MAG: hypothetical protein DRQ52_09055 [Gammaproteobacteria bacterium]
MPNMQDSDYESILHQWLGMVTSAELAEIDGFVCGLVTRQGSPQQLHDLLFTDDSTTDELLEQCATAMNLRFQQLTAFSDLFEPLVADDDNPLSVQAASLATWCYGFLATLGDEQELRERLSDEGYESLQDIQSISQVAADEISDDEENAFVEVFEYVRVAASMVFTDLAAPAANSEDQLLH